LQGEGEIKEKIKNLNNIKKDLILVPDIFLRSQSSKILIEV